MRASAVEIVRHDGLDLHVLAVGGVCSAERISAFSDAGAYAVLAASACAWDPYLAFAPSTTIRCCDASMQAVRYEQYGGPEVCGLSRYRTRSPVRGRCASTCVLRASFRRLEGARRPLKEYFPISLPKIPGRDGAGVVTKLGPDVTTSRSARRFALSQHVEPGPMPSHRARSREHHAAAAQP
jgi:hypothetical protein